MEYGGIYGADQATGTATNVVTGIGSTSWKKVTAFNSLSPADGVGVNAGVDELNVQSDGVYYAFCHLVIFGTLNNEMKFAILKNNLATDVKSDAFISTTGSTSAIPVSLGGLIDLDAGDRITLGVQVKTGSNQVITLHQGHLGVYRVS